MSNKPKAIVPMVPTESLFAVINIYKQMLLETAQSPQSVEVINDLADAVTGIVILELNKE